MTERDIFIAALQKDDADARRAYLAEACGSDAALRARVEELLGVHERAASFLESSPVGPVVTIDHAPAETPGTVVGSYKLLEQIGEGGFGVVFMAEQSHPVRRKVALKVLKPGMDTRQVVARFESERQALAIMDHPNIAKVLDGGVTHSGRPYFVMELVRGAPITEFCDRNHLAPRQRLELFVSVCGAVQHAHQKGIIHRDLKPSNVLVSVHDTTPVVKVIDFGVAKALGQELTDKTLFTGFAQMVGTPLYMSPEQAGQSGLDVDTRSDIYSLGVLLYELLTGTTPFTADRFRKAAYDEIRRIIREEEPPRPSTRLSESKGSLPSIAARRHTEPARLARLVRGELDWVVMKALEKDRARRYETANGFAADVQRYLAGEAVQAVPPGTGYRLRKFVRRTKAALATAAVVLGALVAAAGSVGWVVKDRQAQRATTRHEAETALAEATRLLREGRYAEALAWVNRAEGVLARASGGEGLRERMKDLRADLEMVERLEEIRQRSAEAVTLNSFDSAARERGYEAAFCDYGIDVVTRDAAAGAEQIRAWNIPVELAAALDDWATACRRLGGDRRDRASHLLTVAAVADPDPWRNRLREALQRSDEKSLEELGTPEAIRNLGPASLCQLYRWLPPERAQAVLREAQRRYPADFWVNHELGIFHYTWKRYAEAARYYTAAAALRPRSPGAHYNVGNALQQCGLLDEAAAAFREAIRLKPDYAAPHNNLGCALRDQGKLDEAIAVWREAVRLQPEPDAPVGVYACYNLGAALHKAGRVDESAAAFRDGVRRQREYVCRHPENAFPAWYELAQVLRDQLHAYAAAIIEYREILKRQPGASMAEYGIGVCLERQGRYDDALAAYRRASALDRKHWMALGAIGDILGRDKHDYVGAAAAYREALRIYPDWAAVHCNLGIALSLSGRPGEAIAEFEAALRLNQKGEIDTPQLANASNTLGWLLATCSDPKLRDPPRAVGHAKRAVGLFPNEGTYWNTLGVAHYRAGDRKAAVAALQKSMDLRKGGDGFDRFFLAMAHWQLNDKDEARKWFDGAVAWMDKYKPDDEELRRFRAEAGELLGVTGAGRVEVAPPPRVKK